MQLPRLPREDSRTQLAAEAITLRIRWFGLAMGYVLANLAGRDTNAPILNGILTLGAAYVVIDTIWSVRGRVFLGEWPLLISLMESVFIGLLCNFDTGIDSPFRYYYFLSLLVCAMRHAPATAYATYLLHALSYGALVLSVTQRTPGALADLSLTLVLMGWVTWAGVGLAALIKSAGRRLSQLNEELRVNQLLLEERIDERTRELQESQAHLVQQEKQAAFGLLAAGIAHEVGNPLAAISSLVQMLNRRNPDTYTRERLEMVDDQLRRIQRTLRELVDFSRPATKEESRCDVHELVDAALNIAKYYKRKKGKRIVTRYTEGLPKIKTVRDQLVQVFLNLVLNAMDATEEGGTIEITTSRVEDGLRVEVTDDGQGIPAQSRERLFRPYFTTKEGGTGLGLFVSRNIIEQGGGRLELTRSSPEGTTFTVLLPCAAPQGGGDAETDGEPAHSTEEIHTS